MIVKRGPKTGIGGLLTEREDWKGTVSVSTMKIRLSIVQGRSKFFGVTKG